ncbi:MAG TPA: hypothetical protein DCG33_07330 [Prevotellaceae bacterium]|nr:hypothetical protein [Prevotellaceae bacterium]
MSKKYCTFALDMNKYAPEITTLRMDIEQEVKRKIRTPYDFEFLAGVIWERLHENISPTTLKRLWGYIDGADTTRRTTLCLLSQFLGFADWEAYLASLATRTDIESAAFEGEGIHINNLQPGDRVEVTWLPNRRCVFRYEGDARFTVVEAEHAKLHAGDTFDTTCFLVGKPMYLDNLQRDEVPSTKESVSYVAGSKNGLNSVKLVNGK